VSVRHAPVGWNRTKLVYDAVVLAATALYLQAYMVWGHGARVAPTPLDEQALAMRAWGTCAFLLLTVTLAIGPLARLDRRFLPLLYNRRHLGVITATVATGHAMTVLGWYFAFSPVPPFEALLATDVGTGEARGLPFIPFGIAALLILWLLAATSHDFWLAFLTPPVWKSLHMAVYGAYALIVAHVAFGALQDARAPGLALTVAASAALLTGLHLAAGLRARRELAPVPDADETPWVVATTLDALAEGRGVVVTLKDAEAAAVFRWNGRLSALTNLCAHQNGPLGEGRVLDGCVTCPWHGFQYRLEDGRAPAPFTERLATYRLKLDGETVLLDPRPNPPGTYVEPLPIPGAARTAARAAASTDAP
jgi:nitrite reductase/ring-hydroxylating ferredoxin subunit/DMSO/TMAO reductase YedYZ heme-binding membrane subunit